MAKVERASVGTRKSCLGDTEGALVAQRSRWDGYVYLLTLFIVQALNNRSVSGKVESGTDPGFRLC